MPLMSPTPLGLRAGGELSGQHRVPRCEGTCLASDPAKTPQQEPGRDHELLSLPRVRGWPGGPATTQTHRQKDRQAGRRWVGREIGICKGGWE